MELAQKEEGLLYENEDVHGPPKLEDDSAVFLEELLAKGMKQLTFQEEEEAAFDVHGLSMMEGTNTNVVEASIEEERQLIELAQELAKLNCTSPMATKREFLLMFLRCDDHNVKLSAQRIATHLEVKKDLFGDKCVHSHIELSHLDAEDLRVLESGTIKVCAKRDAAGRFVLLFRPALRPPDASNKSLDRVRFFILTTLARDPQVQSQGIVILLLLTNTTGLRQISDRFAAWQGFKRLRAGVPRKIASVHLCMNSSSIDPISIRVFPLITQLVCRRNVRSRFCSHTGSKELLQFKLQCYGLWLSDEDWPIPNNKAGQLHSDMEDATETTKCSLPSLVSSSTSTTTTKSTSTPTEFDVLLGRGRTSTHPGNVKAAQLAALYRDDYERAKKFEKTNIAERIVGMIQAYSGRFLKYENNEWIEVDHQTARNKISHLYRNSRKKA